MNISFVVEMSLWFQTHFSFRSSHTSPGRTAAGCVTSDARSTGMSVAVYLAAVFSRRRQRLPRVETVSSTAGRRWPARITC